MKSYVTTKQTAKQHTSLELLSQKSDEPAAQWFRDATAAEIQLSENMRPQMTALYNRIFLGAKITYMSNSSDQYRNLHDTIMGIDVVVTDDMFGTITIQEKVRDNMYLNKKYHESRDKCPDCA